MVSSDYKYKKNKRMKKRIYLCGLIIAWLATGCIPIFAKEYQRDIVLTQDGSGDCTTFAQAFEMMRAFMDYKVTLHVRNGVYREKVIVPSWLQNIEIVGENRDSTIIIWGDYANKNNMGTFRTYTVRVDGNHITFRNLTIENDAPQLGQAVALHTEGDALYLVNCRILGNQDTIYTGREGTRLLFDSCYIDGTTDFIFGPATAWFQDCELHSKANSYITAASTPAQYAYGYVFNHCRLTADKGIDKVYLGRPWRSYAAVIFMACEMGNHIYKKGWYNWGNVDNEHTARYEEYDNFGMGANMSGRVRWCHALSKRQAKKITQNRVFSYKTQNPF